MNRIALALVLTAAVACSKPPPPPAAQVVKLPPPPPMAVKPQPADPLALEVVLDKLHALDGELIDAGHLAEKSAHDRKVKKLAEHVASAREKADAELVAMAARLSVSLKNPAQLMLPPEDKAAIAASHDAFAALAAKKGAEFDGSYLSSLDAALKGELGLLTQIDAKSTSPDLKAMSAKLEPVVTEHEKSASEELKSIHPGKS